jgi:hypothetical protein
VGFEGGEGFGFAVFDAPYQFCMHVDVMLRGVVAVHGVAPQRKTSARRFLGEVVIDDPARSFDDDGFKRIVPEEFKIKGGFRGYKLRTVRSYVRLRVRRSVTFIDPVV